MISSENMKGGVCSERWSLERGFLGAGEVWAELRTRGFGEGGGNEAGRSGAERVWMQRN